MPWENISYIKDYSFPIVEEAPAEKAPAEEDNDKKKEEEE